MGKIFGLRVFQALATLCLFSFQIAIFAAEPLDLVRDALKETLPGMKIDSISKTPIPGIYQIVFGSRVIYASEDGQYILRGDLFKAKSRQNLTAPVIAKLRLNAIDLMGEDRMVVFAPEETLHTVTVFTDVDCAFCRKLHNQIADYNALGIKVQYLLYPRSGPNTPSYRKAVGVWCSKDRKQAMTKAKAGEPIKMDVCENPVDSHLALGDVIGVRGTPTIVLEKTGEVVPGYIPPKNLLARLRGQ